MATIHSQKRSQFKQVFLSIFLFFKVDSSKMINLVCHDLKLSGDSHYQNTMSWIKMCQQNAPNSEIRILLTQIDRVEEGQRERLKNAFIDRFSHLIEKEIKLTKNHKKNCADSNKPVYEKHIENYSKIKEQIKPENGSKAKLLKVSCQCGYEATVKAVTDYLMEFAQHEDEETLMMRPLDKELFVKIGTLGIRQAVAGTTQPIAGDKPEMAKERQKEEKTERTNEKSRESHDGQTHFIQTNTNISMQQYGMEEELPKQPHNSIATKRQRESLGSSDNDNQQRIKSCDLQSNNTEIKRQDSEVQRHQKFLKFKDVMRHFNHIYKQYIPETEEITEIKLQTESKKSLANLKERGLLRYYIKDRELNDDDIIFHDLYTLVSILGCVFHHDLHTFLKYDYSETNLGQSQFEEHKSSLRLQGILSMALLEFLLKKSNCLIDAEAVAQMLSSVDIGIIFQTDADGMQKLFIPRFLEDQPPPENMQDRKLNISRCQKELLSLETRLDEDIPLPFFNELRVKIYGKVSKLLRYNDSIKTWGTGMSVVFGKKRGKLLMYYNEDSSVTIHLQANISEVAGHRLLFEYVKFIDTETAYIRLSKYPGLPLDYVLLCTHCIIQLKLDRDIVTHQVKKLLNPISQPDETFECYGQSCPRGLITPLPKGKHLVFFVSISSLL